MYRKNKVFKSSVSSSYVFRFLYPSWGRNTGISEAESKFQVQLKVLSAAITLLFLSGILCISTLSFADSQATEGLFSMSLEELMNLKVTSAFKKPQSIKNTPAAVFVITQEDIRRSGATSIPEVLRMVPGVNVAKIDNGNWAVSIRGFNGIFSDKLLVLMDGRTLYDPLFSGVFWDVQDTMLEDIERIEVIRGPGASSWGTNAVNGVINIITKDAWSTKGGLISAGAGSLERGFGSARYGFSIGDVGAVRFYAKAFERGPQDTSKGASAWDDWRMIRSGFHSDWRFTSKDSATLQGDIYSGDGTSHVLGYDDNFYLRDIWETGLPVSGGNVLGRWVHSLHGESELSFQFYYDHTDRKFSEMGAETRDTLDFEFQHRFNLLSFNDFQWGASYRHTWDDIPIKHGDHMGAFVPRTRKDDLFSLFLQDEMGFMDDKLRFLFGIRLDHNNYTGMEVEPTARVIYSLTSHQNVWAALSRAVRIPSRYNRDAIWILGTRRSRDWQRPVIMAYYGNDDYGSEELWSAETGYRWTACKRLSFDLTAFAYFYDDLFSASPGQIFEHFGMAVQPILPGNHGKANNFGVELTGNFKPFEWWRLEVSYSYLNTNYWVDRRNRENTGLIAIDMEAPEHQVSLRSNMNINRELELDVWLRYVSSLDRLEVPSYTGLDIRLGWHPVKNLELSVTGKDLLDPYHPEYNDRFLQMISTEIPRSVYGKVTWKF